MSPRPTVYVVDDSAAVRDSLKYLFSSLGLPMKAYQSAEDFLKEYDAAWPGCLVLDVRMPGMSGVDLQGKLQELGSVLPIIFLTGHGEIPMAVWTLQKGAVDFLEKPLEQQVLVDCVRRALLVNDGARKAQKQRAGLAARRAALTRRQQEVLDLMLAGHSNKMMAWRLSVGEKTIEFHRARVMRKMQAKNLPQLMRMVQLGQEHG